MCNYLKLGIGMQIIIWHVFSNKDVKYYQHFIWNIFLVIGSTVRTWLGRSRIVDKTS